MGGVGNDENVEEERVLAYFGAIVWRLASCTEVMYRLGCELNHNRMFSSLLFFRRLIIWLTD